MPDIDRLDTIQEELAQVLEERITTLLAGIKACQDVTTRIVTTTLEIQRQQDLSARLDKELGPLGVEADKLRKENEANQVKLDRLKENVEKMRALRSELVSSLQGLAGGLGER
jgi:hypothetical protein